MMVPVGRLVVLRITEKKDLMRSISYITWPGLMAPVLGPPLGGFITTYSSWRWIFYLNVPLGVVGTVLAILWTDNERENSKRSFDWLGFALAGSACVAFYVQPGIDGAAGIALADGLGAAGVQFARRSTGSLAYAARRNIR